MTRHVFIITPDGTEFEPRAAKMLIDDINAQFGSSKTARCITGDAIRKPQLLRAAINGTSRVKDAEPYIVLVRNDEQVYIPPAMMDEINTALSSSQNPEATSWDVLNDIIPAGNDN